MLDYVQRKMKIETPREDLAKAIKDVSTYYLSSGVTSLGDATVTNDIRQWEIFRKLKESSQLGSRINMMPGINYMSQFKEANLRSGSGDNQLKVGPLKMVLNEVNSISDSFQDVINAQVLEAAQAGFQLAIHTIEVSMVESAIKALENARHNALNKDPRYRLEHCSECPPSLIHRLAELRAVIVSQPSFLYFSGERYLTLVKPELLKHLYPFKSWWDYGLTVAGSSDSPVVPVNPIIGIYSSVTRRTESGQVVSPDQCITPEQALDMFTINAAYSTFEEKIKGSVSPGKVADMVLLNHNPLNCNTEKYKTNRGGINQIDGKVVWQK
jgi:predicted amidohydrolase YtcJ